MHTRQSCGQARMICCHSCNGTYTADCACMCTDNSVTAPIMVCICLAAFKHDYHIPLLADNRQILPIALLTLCNRLLHISCHNIRQVRDVSTAQCRLKAWSFEETVGLHCVAGICHDASPQLRADGDLICSCLPCCNIPLLSLSRMLHNPSCPFVAVTHCLLL